MNTDADTAEFAGTRVAKDDLALVHAIRCGDISAFERLVGRYDRKLFRIAQHVTHNREDSEDAVQESFMKALQHLSEFREQSRFSTWLFRITVNQSLMKLRKRRTTLERSCDQGLQAEEDILPREVADGAPSPEELCWSSELRDILVGAIDKLHPTLRLVFVLRDVEELSISQTAMALDLSVPAVKTRLFRARLRLRELLFEHFSVCLKRGSLDFCLRKTTPLPTGALRDVFGEHRTSQQASCHRLVPHNPAVLRFRVECSWH